MSKMRQSSLESVAFRGTMRDCAKLAGSVASILSDALLVGGMIAAAGITILGVSGLIPVEGLRLARLDAGEPSSVQRLAVIRGLAAGKVVEARSAAQGDNAKLASFVPRTDDPDEALGAGMLARRQAPPSGATKYAAAPFGRP